MLPDAKPLPRYRFGPIEVDPAGGEIYKSGVKVRVPKKPFQILLVLLEHPGEVVTRETLSGELWNDGTFVEFEHALNAAMNRLRLVLGDDAAKPRYIETIPGRGYRFIAMLEAAPPEPVVIASPEPLPVPNRRLWPRASVIAAVLAMFAFGIWIGRRSRPAPGPGPTVRFAIPPPPGAVFEPSTGRQAFQLSPDGRYLAFTARGQSLLRSLWIRDFTQPQPREIPEARDAYSVFWPADSTHLYYTTFASAALKTIALSGGPQDQLAQMPPRLFGAWFYRGEIRSSDREEGWAVSLSGGASHKLPMPQPWAQPLPDGRVIYVAWDSVKGVNEVRLALPDQPGETLFESDSRVFLTPSTRRPEKFWLLYMRGGNLVARGFDAAAGRLTNNGPMPIASHVPYFRSTGTVEATVAAGTLVWLDHPDQSQLVWVDRQGRELSSVGPVLGSFNQVRLSKDENWAVMPVIDRDRGVLDAWTVEIATGSVRRVSNSNATMDVPVLSPDGKKIVYGRAAGRPPVLAILPLEPGEVEPLLPQGVPAGHLQQPTDWSADGRFIAETSIPYAYNADRQNGGVYLVDVERKNELVPLVTSPRPDGASGAVFAPDGRTIAFLSQGSGTREVYVQAFDPEGRRLTGLRHQISRGGALVVRWPKPGRELFYLGRDYYIYAANLAGETKRLFQVPQETVSRMHPPFSFDVASGGERFLLPAYRGGRPSSLTVVLNWENLTTGNSSDAVAAR